MTLKTWQSISAITLVCAAVILVPIYTSGLLYGGDQDQHIQFAIEFEKAFRQGKIVPDWATEGDGFGGVGIRVYPPLAYITAAGTKAIFDNWYDAFSLNLFGWMLIGCFGVFWFCREWCDPVSATFGGVLFAIVPYHLIEIYVYFLYAEYVGMAILPYCFLFLTRALLKSRWIDFIGLSIAMSALILAHIPLTIIGSLSLAVYGLALFDWKRTWNLLGRLAVSALVTIASTSAYLLRAILEKSWVAHDSPAYAGGIYGFNSWLFPNMLIDRAWEFIAIMAWLFDIAILLTVALAIPALIYLIFKKRQKDGVTSPLIGLLITAGVAFFMLSRASFTVWEFLPLLQKIQFPWRWLGPLSFLAVVLFAIGISLLFREFKRWRRLTVYGALGMTLLLVGYDVTQTISQGTPKTRPVFDQMVANLSVSRGNEFWRPTWARELAFENLEKITAENRSSHIAKWETEVREFSVGVGQETNVRIATFYYPYWKATVNGQAVPVTPDANGTILVPVPAEAADVRLYFEEPPIYAVASWISLFAWLCIVVGLVLSKSRAGESSVAVVRPSMASDI